MKRFAGIALALIFALPACSAENDTAESPATSTAQTQSAPATRAPARTEAPAPSTAQPEADTVVLATSAADPAPATAVPARRDVVEGRHYRVLTPAQPTSSSPEKVEVAEIFMYSCPHCYTFEPFINTYKSQMPAHVAFIRVPASFNALARVHAKAFYAAETLGVLENIHTDFFRAFHSEGNRLANDEAVIEFLVSKGVDRADAESALKSFAVDTKLRQADTLVRRYRIDSVPTLVINGKYVTSGSMAGSTDKLREIVDHLVAKEAAEL